MAHIRKVNRPRRNVVDRRLASGEKRSQSFKRKADADAFKASVENAAMNRGENIDPRRGRIRFEDMADLWLTKARPKLKAKTVASYESLLRSRVLPEFES